MRLILVGRLIRAAVKPSQYILLALPLSAGLAESGNSHPATDPPMTGASSWVDRWRGAKRDGLLVALSSLQKGDPLDGGVRRYEGLI